MGMRFFDGGDIDLGIVDDYVCPGHGVFPHEECDKYYTCYENSPTHLWKCTLDYLFDLRFDGCNYNYAVDCGDRIKPGSTQSLRPPSFSANHFRLIFLFRNDHQETDHSDDHNPNNNHSYDHNPNSYDHHPNSYDHHPDDHNSYDHYSDDHNPNNDDSYHDDDSSPHKAGAVRVPPRRPLRQPRRLRQLLRLLQRSRRQIRKTPNPLKILK